MVSRPIAPVLGPLPIEMLTPQDLQLLEDFLARRNQLANQDVLGQRILHKMFERMNLPAKDYDHWETDRLLNAILRASKGQMRDDQPQDGLPMVE